MLRSFVAGITADAGGNIVWRARYATWGKLVFENMTGAAPDGFEQNLRMQGQYHDREAGLYYNTFRYYDCDTGRFTTEEPIGLFGGINLYQYAPNPLMWIDPWGWARICGGDRASNTPNIVRRFMSKAEYKQFKKNGFKFNPTNTRGGMSATTTNVQPVNPDSIKRRTGALGADRYVDIDVSGKPMTFKGKTKGGLPDWKIQGDVNPGDIIGSGRVRKWKKLK